MARRERLDGLLLADDALVELVLHLEQTGRLLLGELDDRDAGGHGEDLGDQLLVDLGDLVHVAGAPLLLALGLLGRMSCFSSSRRRAAASKSCPSIAASLRWRTSAILSSYSRRSGGRGHPADAQSRAGLVDEVDGLVRQEPVGDVAVGQRRRRDQRLVGDRDAVVRLVAVAQALEHLDGVRDRRLGDLDRLEAALERGVLLEVLAVLVEGGRADGLQLAAGQHRLEDAGGVDRALGRAGTDEGVDLVDEQHDVAAGADLLEHLLEALLEVTAVARAGHQGAEVERVDLLVLERLGHVALDDVLGQALDDRGLADAGLADEDRVVLRAARQDLHDALDLLLAPDDRVELALAGGLGEVAAELVEHQRATTAPRRRTPAAAPAAGRLLALEAARAAG